MKKTGICLFLALLLISAAAFGEITPSVGPGQFGFDAVVISKSVSIRPEQNANAKAVKKLNFGDHLAVMSLGNGWCECYLSETDGLTGYALEDYLLIDPAYITTEESTPVYAWQARNAKRVGLLGRGETYPIIRMEGDWLLISLRGAAGWIFRPNGDATGTARMRTSDVRKKAEACLLAMNALPGGQKVTAEMLKEFYTYIEYDAVSRQWHVSFDTRNYGTVEISVDDATGEAGAYEPANG